MNIRKMQTAAGGPIYSNGQYKMPKNRKVLDTIKLNNGVLTYEVDDQGNYYWFRNGKYLTPSQIKNYKYYDPEIKGYIKLDTFFTGEPSGSRSVFTPTIDYLNNRVQKQNQKFQDNSKKQSFASNNKIITLRTKGKMNLASIPTNVLDTIAINAGRAGTDIKTALGLIGKESTFREASIPLGRHPKDIEYNPYDLTNNHAYFISPETDYITQLFKNYYGHNDKERANKENKATYDLAHNLIKGATPHYSENIMADAFERYTRNPRKYNPGQSNYAFMVTNIGNEVFGYKPIQDWYNTEGVEYYNKGLSERYKKGGKMNILEFLKNGSGIHIKEKNKGKFTKSAKAAGQTVQEHARSVLNDPNATPLQKKRANFARNAAKWHHKHQYGGEIINMSPLVTAQLNWVQNASEYLKKKKELDEQKKLLELQNRQQTTDMITNVGEMVMNYLPNLLNRKNPNH